MDITALNKAHNFKGMEDYLLVILDELIQIQRDMITQKLLTHVFLYQLINIMYVCLTLNKSVYNRVNLLNNIVRFLLYKI